MSYHIVSNPARDGTDGSIWTNWPNLKSYLYMVEGYSKRTLGHQEDMLHAFSAFATVFGRAMKGGVLYGVPELFFHAMLLFSFTGPASESQRRISADRDISAHLPSWSWAAWTGSLDFDLTEAFYQYLSEPTNILYESDDPDTPLITHFLVPDIYKILVTKGGKQRVRIKDLNYWRARQPDVKTDSSCLPDGYRFECYVPVMDSPHETPLDPHTSVLPVIEFRTSRIFGNMIYTCPDSGATMMDLEMKGAFFIQGIHGSVIGYLDIRGSDRYPGDLGDLMCNDLIELISVGAMDMGWTGQSFRSTCGSAYLHRHCPKDPDVGKRSEFATNDFKCGKDRKYCRLPSDWTYRFHNVMWIEWRNGVAYRKAIGKIYADAWDRAEPEGIDVVLG